jgi:hypothetical protein
MHSLLEKELADTRAAELREWAGRGRAKQVASANVVVRRAKAADGPALAALAALDEVDAPVGGMLVAEVDGSLRAALPLDGGRAFADPFRPTAQLVELLRLRAQQVRVDRRLQEHGGLFAWLVPAVRRLV